MRLQQILGASLLAAAVFAEPATQPLQITAVRFWSLGDSTRVAIETNGAFHYKSDRIPNPDRLFFDLQGARPHLGGKGITVKQVGDKFLKRVRIAENVPGATRIVLDLEGDVDYTASQLESPDRLIIELHRANAVLPVPVTKAAPPAAPLAAPSTPIPVPLPPAAFPVIPASVSPVPPPVVSPVLTEQPALAKLANAPPPPPGIPVDNRTANPARRTTADGSRSLTRALGLKINRVVIDPGHGGHDQGTSGAKGLLEKDLVLDVSLRLGKLIEERMGSEVILTRSDDTFIALQERTAIANRKKADLFFSIHANSSPATHVTGIETYYLNFTNSSDAVDVASRENAGSDKSVYELQDLVQTIAKHDKMEESREFAGNMQAALQAFESRNSPTAKDRGVRKAPFMVLIGAQMPSVLAEIGFLSNAREESQLSKPEYRQKLAEALYKGLAKYAQTLSHFELTRTSANGSGKVDELEK